MKQHLQIDTPFWMAVDKAFKGELRTPEVSYSGKKIDYFGYQLATSKFQLSIWSKGMKPTRHFKISDLKWYYGLKGNNEKMLEQFEEIRTTYNSYFGFE
jgi:hypothetical protein